MAEFRSFPSLGFHTSWETDKLDLALAKAQGEIGHAHKDSENPFFKSNYADLASVWDACREALSKYEIAVTQWPIPSGGKKVNLVTRIAHKGQWMQSGLEGNCRTDSIQDLGSAITYLRRYMLAPITGVAPEEFTDDDGNKAAGKGEDRPPQTQGTPAGLPPSAASNVKIGPRATSTDPKPVQDRVGTMKKIAGAKGLHPDILTGYMVRKYKAQSPVDMSDQDWAKMLAEIQTKEFSELVMRGGTQN